MFENLRRHFCNSVLIQLTTLSTWKPIGHLPHMIAWSSLFLTHLTAEKGGSVCQYACCGIRNNSRPFLEVKAAVAILYEGVE